MIKKRLEQIIYFVRDVSRAFSGLSGVLHSMTYSTIQDDRYVNSLLKKTSLIFLGSSLYTVRLRKASFSCYQCLLYNFYHSLFFLGWIIRVRANNLQVSLNLGDKTLFL